MNYWRSRKEEQKSSSSSQKKGVNSDTNISAPNFMVKGHSFHIKDFPRTQKMDQSDSNTVKDVGNVKKIQDHNRSISNAQLEIKNHENQIENYQLKAQEQFKIIAQLNSEKQKIEQQEKIKREKLNAQKKMQQYRLEEQKKMQQERLEEQKKMQRYRLEEQKKMLKEKLKEKFKEQKKRRLNILEQYIQEFDQKISVKKYEKARFELELKQKKNLVLKPQQKEFNDLTIQQLIQKIQRTISLVKRLETQRSEYHIQYDNCKEEIVNIRKKNWESQIDSFSSQVKIQDSSLHDQAQGISTIPLYSLAHDEQSNYQSSIPFTLTEESQLLSKIKQDTTPDISQYIQAIAQRKSECQSYKKMQQEPRSKIKKLRDKICQHKKAIELLSNERINQEK